MLVLDNLLVMWESETRETPGIVLPTFEYCLQTYYDDVISHVVIETCITQLTKHVNVGMYVQFYG